MIGNKKVYTVVHYYEVDGGFGDAIGEHDTIALFLTRKEAEDFVEKYSLGESGMGVVYDKPYAELTCGCLVVEERNIGSFITEDEMWWLEYKE